VSHDVLRQLLTTTMVLRYRFAELWLLFQYIMYISMYPCIMYVYYEQ